VKAERYMAGERSAGNRLFTALATSDQALLRPYLIVQTLKRGQVLVEAGDDVTKCYLPCKGTVASLVVALPNGTVAETASIGCEGAVGGIVSQGHKPAFARAVVIIEGPALCLDCERLEELKAQSASLRDMIARYTDCLLAQVLQSVACSALHSLEQRFCRWLLHFHDRAESDEVPLTQEMLAEMVGVQRTTLTAVAATLQARGMIKTLRGRIFVNDRDGLESTACCCHATVVAHFNRVLVGVYPAKVY
jgi:CRP-like cAMP-binding protein